MSNINIDSLANEISKSLTNYGQEVKKATNKVVKKIAKETVANLKATSPRRKDNYAKGWTSSNEEEFATSTKSVVHNKKHYRLTHLLEKGHALANGERSRKFVHIKPAEEKAIEKLENEVREAIENAE